MNATFAITRLQTVGCRQPFIAFKLLTVPISGLCCSALDPIPFGKAHSWHSPFSQYSQLGVVVQLAPGFAAQTVAEQPVPGVGGGGVGGEGAEQGERARDAKVQVD